MPEHNPNRDLSADQVVHLFAKQLPQLVSQLGADRDWIWFVSDGKPPEEVRTALKDIGFSFTPILHSLPDGRAAHWYHSCGGAVLRRRRGGAHTEQNERKPHRRMASSPARNRVAESKDSDFAELARIADLLPS